MKTTVKILKKPLTSTVIAIVFGFIVAAIILAFAGYNPLHTFIVMFNGIFSRPKFIANVIIKSTPIILTGLSVAFAFKTGLFNIGAEGQYIMGTVVSTVLGIILDLPGYIEIPVIIIGGIVAGAVWGSIVGILKAKFGIHEVITSIMLNWISLYLCNFVAYSELFHKPDSNGTYPVNSSALTMILPDWKFSGNGRRFLVDKKFLNEILLKTDLNVGIVVAIIAAILIWFLLYRTKKGFELRAVGFNCHASKCSGINVSRNIIQSMIVAGALAGLAGVLTVTGMSPHNIYTLSVFENNGFNGLSVALIAGSSPIGCIFSGLLFSGLIYAGQSVQSYIGAPSEIINIMIGVIVFFVALTKIVPVLAEKLGKRRSKNVK